MMRPAVILRIVVVAALPGLRAPPVNADIIPGATIGGQLYRVGAEQVFVRYLGSHAAYTNDVWWFPIFPPVRILLFTNQLPHLPVGAERTLQTALQRDDEIVFAICNDISALPPLPHPLSDDIFARCRDQNTFLSGSGERNRLGTIGDGLPHAALWTREAWLAGCAAQPDYCDPAGVAALIGDPSYPYVMGFEDSRGYGVDADFNDMVIAVRGATVIPEPVTLSLLATGLAGIGGAGWVRRRRARGDS